MTSPTRGKRLLSLDVFRGLTVAGMIVVNTPGNNSGYDWLDHAPWHGCTPADLVFPFFLFIMGAALAFASPKTPTQILKRAAILFALGLMLNAIPHYQLGTLRLMGVLQRIALCYLACAAIESALNPRAQISLTAAILLGYWLLLAQGGDMTVEGNLPAKLDRLILGAHTYRSGSYDLEGFLSTGPAVATTLIGLICGRGLRTPGRPEQKAAVLAVIGLACAGLGRLWGLAFPINKALWTSSFVLYTGGLAAFALADIYWLCDIDGTTAWGRPFEALGVNAIAAYVLPILLLKLMVYTRIDGTQPRLWLCAKLFETWLSPANASAAFAFAYAALWTGAFTLLKRRRIAIKI
jgi:predicted acyltransferase